MKKIRSSDSAWQLLQQLVSTEADLVQCSDPDCFRFHMRSKGVLGCIVRNSTMKTLATAGLVTRLRSATPTYAVSDKGLNELEREFRRRAFGETRLKLNENLVEGWSVALSAYPAD